MFAAKVLIISVISVYYLGIAEPYNTSRCPDGPTCLEQKRNAWGRISIPSGFYQLFLEDRYEAGDRQIEPRVSYEDTEDVSNIVDYDSNANGIGGNSRSGYKNSGGGYKNSGNNYKNGGGGRDKGFYNDGGSRHNGYCNGDGSRHHCYYSGARAPVATDWIEADTH